MSSYFWTRTDYGLVTIIGRHLVIHLGRHWLYLSHRSPRIQYAKGP